ncbi:ribosomal RNA-processing protein 8 [Megalops cyprinoides]|uniref:ribosomal RNA-processing protein 8 n=1 Tax=Megalops cyprinoides TaxID=118141 RepID=UPI0018653042|nr:ribosomal RNA-processing protein 8 [Megalops cyprinoides]
MFAEEDEWNDDQEAKALTRAVIHGTEQSDSTNVTQKGVGKKKSLLRTLQTLGSIPNWDNEAQRGGSDSDTEGVPSHTKRKKKRCKKRKRGHAAGTEAEATAKQQTTEEHSGTAVKKKKKSKEAKPGKPELARDRQRKDSQPEKEKEEEKEKDKAEGGEKLSRQQWKNKMKNKRKCHNKYRQQGQATPNAPKAETKLQEPGGGKQAPPVLNGEKEAVLAQTPKQETKAQKQKKLKPKKRKRPEEGEEETNSSPSSGNTESVIPKKDLANKEPKLRGETERTAESATKDSVPEEKIVQTEKTEKDPEVSAKRKWRESKEKRIRAEKLRRMLNSEGLDSKERSTEEEEEKEVEEDTPSGAGEEGVVPDRSAALRSRMEQRLESARFRYINEQLYTSSSGEARRMFRQDPQARGIYHRGYTAQVQRWPANPVDAIISFIRNKPASLVVADFGCGDCKIARSVKNKVHSFDLAPVCDLVTVCDMADVPLRDASVDIAVFCLSLMGTNLRDFLVEANRVLVMGGVLKIAEVASRFENVRSFVSALSGLGFKLVSKDTENTHFYSFEFVKTGDAPESYKKSGLELKPCVYKKR